MALGPDFCDNPRAITRPYPPAAPAREIASPDRRGFDDFERIPTELLMADAKPTNTDPTPTPTVPDATAPTPHNLGGSYNASMIKSLDDVEHVRTRPGMYI